MLVPQLATMLRAQVRGFIFGDDESDEEGEAGKTALSLIRLCANFFYLLR
jgi:hypothetical protein